MTSGLTGTLPEYGFLPPGSSLPFEGDKNFIGRQLEMRALAQILTTGNLSSDSSQQMSTPLPTTVPGWVMDSPFRGAVIIGCSGVGKTLMATEFCYRYGHVFRSIHWLKADNNLAGQNWNWEVTASGISSGLRPHQVKLDEQAQFILNLWAKDSPHLVVLDDIGDTTQLLQLLDTFKNVCLLITTENKEWENSNDFFILPISSLTDLESLFLLRRISPRLETLADNLITPLANYFGNLPLSLHVAAHFLNFFDEILPLEYVAFLDELQTQLSPILVTGWLKQYPFQHADRLLLCIAYGWQQLDEEQDFLARQVLDICCYFAPDIPIPLDLIKQSLPDQEISHVALEEAVKVLSQFGFIIPVPEGVVIKGPVATFGCMADEFNSKSILPDLVSRLTEFTYQLNEKKECEQLFFIRRHIEAVALVQEKSFCRHLETSAAQDNSQLVTESLMPGKQGSGNISGLWNEIGFALNNLSDFKGAKACFERAMQIDIKACDKPDMAIARDLNNLGGVCRSDGDLLEARKYFQDALRMLEDNHGLSHPDASSVINNLGGIWQTQGDLTQATHYYEMALRVDEANFGPDHPYVASDIRRLAGAACARGDLEQAKNYYEWALWIDETALGPEHPKVAAGVTLLANILNLLGQWGNTQAEYERALKIAESIYGQEDPKLIQYIRPLAEFHHTQKNLGQARIYFERLVKMGKTAFGTEQLEDVSALGFILREMNDLVGAKPYFELALQISESVLDADHPDIARCELLLGEVLFNLGDLPEAAAYQKRALALLEILYGDEHLSVAEAACSYGDTLYALVELPQAKLCYEHALKVFEAQMGSTHSKTTSARDTLNDIIDAETNFIEISVTQLEMIEQNLDQVTLEDAVSANNRGNLLRTQGDLIGAREAYKQALHIWRILLGVEHPNVASAYTNLGIVLRTQGNLEGARICFERGLQISEKALGPSHVKVAVLANNLAGILELRGDMQGARANLERALSIDETIYGVDHPNIADRLNSLGQVQNAMGDHDSALKSHRRALYILQQYYPVSNPEIQKTLEWLRP